MAIWSLGGDTAEAELILRKVGELSLPDSGWVVETDGVAVDPAGERVYVLDELGPRLLVFTLDGALVGELGRRGTGPGEFEMPVAIDVDSQGVVRVIDGSRSLLLSWDRQGEFLNQERLPVPYWGPGFEVSRGALLYVEGDESEESGGFTEVLTMSSGAEVSNLVSLRQEWVEVSSGCGNMPLPKPMTPSITWHANERYTVVARWPDYVLQVFEGGVMIASLRREIPPTTITEDQVKVTIADGPLGFLVESCGMTEAQVLHTAGFVDLVSPIDRIIMDPLNRIWVRSNAMLGDSGPVDLLDTENGYLGSASTPGFPVAFISEERFLAVSNHDWGSSVDIWSIQQE